ncbi:MAG: sarcosine oxidase subunit delta [Micromonosporaceae bacterium]|nr:sarcosine oxidase subunit delta [Micromonosporaceae bacterium]
MLLLPCPWCGPRNVSEFGYSGEVVTRPDPRSVTLTQWRAYLYLRDNRADWASERWFHRMGCRRYFTVRRHRLNHEVHPTPDDGAAPKGQP